MDYRSLQKIFIYFSFLYLISFHQGCLDIDLERNISITPFPGGKRAALSFTFDDGCYSVLTKIAPLFQVYGYKATFFIVPGYIKSNEYWVEWKRFSDVGFEIGNHSLTHADLRETTDRAVLNREINDSYDLIAEKIGTPPFSFAHPYHKTSRATDAIIFERHYASKITPANFCSLYSLEPGYPGKFEEVIKGAIEKGKWIVTSAHGVDDCFNPLSEEDLNALLQIAQEYEGDLAIGTFGQIAKYKIEKRHSLVVAEETAGGLSLSLITLSDSPVSDVPLTIRIADPSLIRCTIKSVNQNKPIKRFTRDGALFIEIAPGSTVELIR